MQPLISILKFWFQLGIFHLMRTYWRNTCRKHENLPIAEANYDIQPLLRYLEGNDLKFYSFLVANTRMGKRPWLCIAEEKILPNKEAEAYIVPFIFNLL